MVASLPFWLKHAQEDKMEEWDLYLDVHADLDTGLTWVKTNIDGPPELDHPQWMKDIIGSVMRETNSKEIHVTNVEGEEIPDLSIVGQDTGLEGGWGEAEPAHETEESPAEGPTEVEEGPSHETEMEL